MGIRGRARGRSGYRSTTSLTRAHTLHSPRQVGSVPPQAPVRLYDPHSSSSSSSSSSARINNNGSSSSSARRWRKQAPPPPPFARRRTQEAVEERRKEAKEKTKAKTNPIPIQRRSQFRLVCSQCRANNIIEENTPLAQALLGEYKECC